MFPSSFYQPSTYRYRTPSPDHRRAVPFTVANVDSYDLFSSSSPQAYAQAEASVLEHLQRQAQLEAIQARERQIERQRRLARIAALEEARQRQYHQQEVIDAYLEAQARARAQAEAERLQRERQRQYQERVRAIAQAQAIQRERAERARAAEIERRREEARKRIFFSDLVDSLFSDVSREAETRPAARSIQQPQHPQTQHVAQPRVSQPTQHAQTRLSHPAPVHRVSQPHVVHREPRPARTVEPQAHQARWVQPQLQQSAEPSADSEQEAFERFLNSFFGVASPHIAEPHARPARKAPTAPAQEAKPQLETKRSVTFSQPQSSEPKPAESAAPAQPAPPAKLRPAAQLEAQPEDQQADELANLLSTVFGIPLNVRNVESKSAEPLPVQPSSNDTAKPVPPAAAAPERVVSPIQRPPSPGPEAKPVPSDVKPPAADSEGEEEVSEEFKQMVDKVFKDLEKVFGVHLTDDAEGEKKGDDAAQKDKVPQSADASPAKPVQAESAAAETAKEPAATPATVDEPVATNEDNVPAKEPVGAPAGMETESVHPADVAPSEEVVEPSTEETTEETTEISDVHLDDDDDDVPSSAADLQDEKAKIAATLIQQKYRKHHARVQRLEKLENLRAKLNKLVAGFTFPDHLDFQDPESGLTTPALDPVDGASHDGDERVTAVPPLAFTHNNAPYHAHAQALLGLLVAADAISSDGDKEVRRARKEFVKEVEEKLAEMERQRSAVFRKQEAEKHSKAEVTSDTVKGDATETPKPEPSDASATASTTAAAADTMIGDVDIAPVASEAVVVTDEDVLTAPVVEEETSTDSTKPTDASTENTKPGDASVTAESTRAPAPAVEDASEVESIRAFTASSVASEPPHHEDFVVL